MRFGCPHLLRRRTSNAAPTAARWSARIKAGSDLSASAAGKQSLAQHYGARMGREPAHAEPNCVKSQAISVGYEAHSPTVVPPKSVAGRGSVIGNESPGRFFMRVSHLYWARLKSRLVNQISAARSYRCRDRGWPAHNTPKHRGQGFLARSQYMQLSPFDEEAEHCRRQALAYLGRPEAPFLLKVAREFDRLARERSQEDIRKPG
jgi:hypothetical protein